MSNIKFKGGADIKEFGRIFKYLKEVSSLHSINLSSPGEDKSALNVEI